MRNLYNFTLLCTSILFLGSACQKDKLSKDEQVSRQQVIDDYNSIFSANNVFFPGWTGSINGCNAGDIPAEIRQKYLNHINYFRRMAGFKTDIVLDSAFNQSCQAGALMYASNFAKAAAGPDSTWKCLSQPGIDAWNSSMVYQYGVFNRNFTGIYAMILGPLEASSPYTDEVAQRRWLLHSKTAVMGIGASEKGLFIKVFGAGTEGNTAAPEFIAWPPKGFVKSELFPLYWSFGIPGADFSSAYVSMTYKDKTKIPCYVNSNMVQNIGDNAIVWKPQNLPSGLEDEEDLPYQVTVHNVRINGSLKSYSYEVINVQ